MSAPRLGDGLTTLRAFTDDDAASYAAILRDELNVTWAGSNAAATDETARQEIRDVLARGWQAGDYLRFAVEEDLGAGPEVIGTVSLQRVFRPAGGGGSASVGIKLAGAGRGRGSGTRAVELLCGYAYGTLGVDILHWQATVGNTASRSLAERAGFTLAATIPGFGHVDGAVADGWVFSQTASHWHARGDAPAPELEPAPVVPALTDGSVVLRALDVADAGALVANCRDAEAVRWTTVPLDYTMEHALGFINEITVDGWRTGKNLTFAVADAATNALLGTIDLQCNAPGQAAIGINFGVAARGTGAAERAVRLLVDFAFTQLNLSYLHWTAMVPNWGSRKLAWKVGFVLEGTIRGGYSDRGTPADKWVLTLADGDARTPAGPWDGPARPTDHQQVL
ncbi:GNAT family N-acetyltransferase [Specibacter cremeus]|uniref:GNAT family N-acetyltransferase n=1 Tax=Specibacter cremeus TaxID=1629051 RepID=UPI000F78EC33|nr:GNAT family protein [Specibacter cremeus]